jgi:glycosyltransferase involved in cell wall biosynthesis
LPVVKSDSSLSKIVNATVVIPIFNPGDYFIDHIVSIYSLVQQIKPNVELILVNDGSESIQTEKIPKSIFNEITLISHSTNLGKGAALKTGFKEAQGDWVGFIDADGDIPARFLIQILDAINFENSQDNHVNPDLIISSKILQDSKVNSSIFRKLSSFSFGYITKIFFDLPVRDTQTGLKMFSKKVLDSILNLSAENGFLIDLELLNLAKINGYTNFKEIPVTIIKRRNSTLSFKTGIEMLTGIFRLKHRLSKITRQLSEMN